MPKSEMAANLEAALGRAGFAAVYIPEGVQADHLHRFQTLLRAREVRYTSAELQQRARMLRWRSRVMLGEA